MNNESNVLPLDEVTTLISSNLQENMTFLSEELSIDKCFDLCYRVIDIGEVKSVIYFIDGFTRDETLQRISQFLLGIKKSEMPADVHTFSKRFVPYGEVGLETEMKPAIISLLSGITLLFIEGYDRAITIDCRTYPVRSVEEPIKDKVLKGSRDGFVETLTSNTALIRRRIRDPHLIMEFTRVGERSQTDISICYLSDKVDENMLSDIKDRLSRIKVDALTMNQQSLAECMYPYKWYNPFPKFRFTERPDTASACLLEGNVIILVDNSPAAMVLPSSFCDIIEEANDYYFPPITGTYLRLSRLLTSILALFLTPTFLLLIENPECIPSWLSFIQISESPNVPFWLQFLILEFAIDGLKLAAVNTPDMLNTPLSIIAGIVLGEYAVESGWFTAEILLYMAFVAVASYSQSSFELGYALKFLRIQFLILTALFSIWGYIAGLVIIILAFTTNKTITKDSYLYPIKPFSFRKLLRRLIRGRLHYEIVGEKNQNVPKN